MHFQLKSTFEKHYAPHYQTHMKFMKKKAENEVKSLILHKKLLLGDILASSNAIKMQKTFFTGSFSNIHWKMKIQTFSLVISSTQNTGRNDTRIPS